MRKKEEHQVGYDFQFLVRNFGLFEAFDEMQPVLLLVLLQDDLAVERFVTGLNRKR